MKEWRGAANMSSKTAIVGYIEGCSTILLMGVAMPLKYLGGNEVLVKLLGPIYGMLFVIYIAMLFLGVSKTWNKNAFVIGFIAAIVPGGPFWFESKLKSGNWAITQD